MGMRYRKSFKIAPGVRMTVSRGGIGYSVGGKGIRVTKRADGRIQTTVGLPGTGLSYSGVRSARTTGRGSTPVSAGPTRVSARPTLEQRKQAARRAKQAAPMSRRIKTERWLILAGILLTIVGFAVIPVLLPAVLCLFVGLIMMLLNIKQERHWFRAYKVARAEALAEILGDNG